MVFGPQVFDALSQAVGLVAEPSLLHLEPLAVQVSFHLLPDDTVNVFVRPTLPTCEVLVLSIHLLLHFVDLAPELRLQSTDQLLLRLGQIPRVACRDDIVALRCRRRLHDCWSRVLRVGFCISDENLHWLLRCRSARDLALAQGGQRSLVINTWREDSRTWQRGVPLSSCMSKIAFPLSQRAVRIIIHFLRLLLWFLTLHLYCWLLTLHLDRLRFRTGH